MKYSRTFPLVILIAFIIGVGCSTARAQLDSTKLSDEFQVTSQSIDTNSSASEKFLNDTLAEDLVFSKLNTHTKIGEPSIYHALGNNGKYKPIIIYYNSPIQLEPDFHVVLMNDNVQDAEYSYDKISIYKDFGLSDPALVTSELGLDLKIGQIVPKELIQNKDSVKVINPKTRISVYANKDQIVISVLRALKKE